MAEQPTHSSQVSENRSRGRRTLAWPATYAAVQGANARINLA